MVVVAVLLFALASGGSVRCALLTAFSAAFISGAAQAINDYYDYDVDKKEDPPRHALIKYGLPRKYALYVAAFSCAVGLVLAYLASWAHLAVAAFASILIYAYSARMAELKYVGNAVVALLVGLAFVYGGLCGRVILTLFPAFLAFLATWSREVMKDLEDLQKDVGKKTTLPMVAGKHMSAYFAAYLLILAVFFSAFPGPWGFKIFGKYYYPAVAVADLVFMISALYIIRGHPREAETACKVAMILALLAFALGVLLS
ncbi:MAG: UbiA family prenyltransferase [Candidatus Diapherotrites archaeon]|nr:UbiA family prenyltransferase [Candidatus Diapherotrites archaeon]